MPKRQRNLSLRWLVAVQADESLTSAAKAAASALYTFMNADGSNCYPGLDSLSTRTGLHRTSIMRGLTALSAAGYLDRQKARGMKVGSSGRARTDRYVPLIPDEVAQSNVVNG